MDVRYLSEEELREIAKDVLDFLGPRRLTVGQIKKVAELVAEGTEYIVLTECREN